MSSLKESEYHKKTILQVVPALVSGGVERGTVEIARQLGEVGYKPIIVSAGGPLVGKLERFSTQHIKLNVASKNPLVIWNNAKLIAEIVKEYKVDLIHARSRAPAWSCYMAAKATGKSFITTFHGIYSISSWLKRYYNSIMTEGERVIAVSNFVKQHILDNYHVNSEKIRVIHRGVDHRYFDPSKVSSDTIYRFKEKYNVPQGVPVILLPSRMTSWKGHMVLVEALSKIKNLDFYCLIVGDLSKHPNFTKRVKDRIVELKLQSKVQIFGQESDMVGLYSLANIILSTSIAPEAFGRTIIEGQAMEKLVIATDIGGAAETIIDKVTGFHIPPNDPIKLAEQIRYCLAIIGEEEERIVTKAARRSAIENFSLDLMLKKTIDVYNELI